MGAESDQCLKCRHPERSKDSVQKLTECQVLDGDSAEEKQLNVAFLRGLSEIQSISVAYSNLNKEILRSLMFPQDDRGCVVISVGHAPARILQILNQKSCDNYPNYQ